ncbi:nitroreductase/quinone reductase family protein [Smaragdicoccus niigatensis]|uniref:nitroreductase/quinone reductase family protein n=1 Tax=Smaragdicoccus niigatensis TaxID=359359 RepID=UPI00036875EB|nr:nitroreductase/quinone reductase family protein [Smaragdicoccus niigatensis]
MTQTASPVRNAVRTFNKYVTNPIMMPLAGRKYWYASVISHVGRRSGKVYRTPVVADRVDSGFLIPLPYGTHVDWLRNVQAAEFATIRSHGVTYDVAKPEVIDAATALALLDPRHARSFERFGIAHFVRLTDAH